MSSNCINKVILVGNIGKDPEVRTMQNGKEMVTFSIATTESWIDRTTGLRSEKTEWHNIVVFNEGLVRIIKDYARKGNKVYVEGALRTRKWVDQNNNDKYVTEIVLQGFNCTFCILDSKAKVMDNDSASTSNKDISEGGSSDYNNDFNNFEMSIDDDIPF